MQAKTGRVYDMCLRALEWLGAHPDDEPGYLALVVLLQTVTARMTQAIADQRTGLVNSLAATSRKLELRRAILAVAIPHLAEIGKQAAQEVVELATTFRYRPTAKTLRAFQTAVRVMYQQALAHKELMVKHGLSESVLADLGRQLDEFDAAMKLGAESRAAHINASKELIRLTREARQIVRRMDARNRVRFRNDQQTLGLWVTARTVVGEPANRAPEEKETTEPVVEGGTPGAGGDVRPAA
jgi:hypothetical protein